MLSSLAILLRVMRWRLQIEALELRLTEAPAEPLDQLQTRIQRRMRFRFAPRHIAGRNADVGHPLDRLP